MLSDVPPSRQCSVCPARNFTHESWSSFQVERSVAIGLRRELPLNGSEKKSDGLDNLLNVACSTSCCMCWRSKSVHDRSSWFSRTRDRIRAWWPVRCVGPLWKRQPCHCEQRAAVEYGQ